MGCQLHPDAEWNEDIGCMVCHDNAARDGVDLLSAPVGVTVSSVVDLPHPSLLLLGSTPTTWYVPSPEMRRELAEIDRKLRAYYTSNEVALLRTRRGPVHLAHFRVHEMTECTASCPVAEKITGFGRGRDVRALSSALSGLLVTPAPTPNDVPGSGFLPTDRAEGREPG